MKRMLILNEAVGALSGPTFAGQKLFDTNGMSNMFMDGAGFGNCLAEDHYAEGTLMWVRFLDDRSMSSVSLFNADWTRYEEGEEGPVNFSLDDAAAQGDVYHRRIEGLHGADIVIEGLLLLDAIAPPSTLSLILQGATVASVGLDGSAAALEKVIACQAA
jgi:hypothetical protein